MMPETPKQSMPPEIPKQKVPRSPNRRLAYFRDDQITFLVTPQEGVTEDLMEWRKTIDTYLEGGHIIWPPRRFSFPPAPPSNEYQPSQEQLERLTSEFSIIVCDVEDVAPDPRDFLELISRLNTDEKLRNKQFGGLTVKDVSPNWLSSVASNAGGTGGPGGMPIPFRGMPERVPYRFSELLSKLRAEELYGDGEGVDVVILDTAPCPHDLIDAYKECKSWHPLIRTLLGPTGKLRLHPASYNDLLRMGSTSLNRHDYRMTDHGLFIAGIIHSIVPQATIHLIEVLNAYGVGDLATLAGGLAKVYNVLRKPDRRLVVNCSWMLELPLDPKHCYAESAADPEFEFEQSVLRYAQNDRDQAFALRAVCELLAGAGSQVIAAAGNDGRAGTPRMDAPMARYPAAFERSIGVGAVPKDAKPDEKTNKYPASSYSNKGDRPPRTGVLTLGGETDEDQGVLGLYLGEFPGCEPKPNCTKWAWWAGTSFATPILTGAIAAVRSSPNDPGRTELAFQELRRITGNGESELDEVVLPVRQSY